MFTIIGAVAELERNLIKERVVMGLARVRGQGKKLGRPTKGLDRAEALRLKATGLTHRAIAAQLGVSHTLVGQALRAGQ